MQTAGAESRDGEELVRALLHRWFVEYNPLYLVSAALVLSGAWLIWREVAHHTFGLLGVAAIAELYALALIGGAAILARLELRRPAVMLGLLAVLYQCDLTLHVEACAYLGPLGRLASAAWLALFALKLHALSRALELRLSRSAWCVALAGALGLALIPHLLREIESPHVRSLVIAAWLFAVGAGALFTRRTVESCVVFDARGRRSLRASWVLLAIGALAHALYWASTHRVDPGPLLALAPVLALRWARRERSLYAGAGLILAAVAMISPASLSVAALMTCALFVLRALRAPVILAGVTMISAPPYRGIVAEPQHVEGVHALTPPARATRGRLLAAALACGYVAAWTAGWEGGALPLHEVALVMVLAAACVGVARYFRRWLNLAPVGPVLAHLVVQRGWTPRSALAWGVSATLLGFVVLVGSVVVSWQLQRRSLRSSR